MIRFERVRVLAGERQILGVTELELSERRISVIGPNGGGKSTLLQLVNGLIEPRYGSVETLGQDTIDHGRAIRRRVGYVFAQPTAQLVMPTPIEDLELSLRRGIKEPARRRERALACLEELGIADLAGRSSHELSGGQQQLVALATVLVLRPEILLLDEPTTLLDLANARRFHALVDSLAAQHDIQVLMATHDLEAAAAAQRCLLVDEGGIVDDGDPDTVIAGYRARSGG